ncbi:TetR/AcrR family transcriptional regulator [Clostridium akagii]|uniref:TetR/AcrR family transcriptional regulator n=1 Tax=Clostridium akagii TaxID=91623 RepID=UPI00047DE10C|nr:TetR/AcrR family transcriptional regulator [Clostridium akagii]
MAKGFSSNEKETIRETLLNAAENCWSKYGIRKTSVDELVKIAGISKGAFYLFYKSKELLFWDVLQRIDERLKNMMIETLKDCNCTKKQAFMNGLRQMISEVEKNPFILNLQNGDYVLLMRKLTDEQIKMHLSSDDDKTKQLFKFFDIDTDIEFVSSVIRTLFFTTLHQNEIGKIRFDDVTEFLIESLANKIFIGGISDEINI